MAIYQSLVIAYSKSVYIDGTRTFPTIRQEYVPYVKQYAASNYTLQQIDNALVVGYITQQEYDDTILLRPSSTTSTTTEAPTTTSTTTVQPTTTTTTTI